MLRIFNDRVYGLEESLIASGYPMVAESIEEWNEDYSLEEKDYKRASKLGNVATGTGHDNFLKGIIVQFDVTYPNYWTPQFQRYHFADIVSSTSKMHRLTKMDLKKSCNEYVDDVVIENLNKWIEIFNSFEKDEKERVIEEKVYTKYEIYMKIISNCPMGLEQTMRVTTSYLQLKTIYLQRRYHKLKEDWGNFCDWCLTLPHFEEFCLNNK
ncbi:hypothetical protein [uncultured Cetobacterium sp.]|uniref:hypothetical protein n=1 Tax=uncultured Cetobacterium sp. TaxID=527638 RepID=UPI002613C83A|nr:hypothetical protein [uncultured Cetobacterium sp.]